MIDIKIIARQQVVFDGTNHECCICQKYKSNYAVYVISHLVSMHKDILTAILKVQEKN